MISKIHLSAILFVAFTIMGILLIVNGIAVSISWLRYSSISVGILMPLLGAFDIWLWKLPLLRGWFVKRPNINGTWQVIIRPRGGEPIRGYLTVRQTFSFLNMRLMTGESASELLGVEIIRSRDKTYQIAGVYRNEPRLAIRDRSPIHHGALLLRIIGRPPTALNGHYWTDRETIGEIELTDRQNQFFDDFETARRKLDPDTMNI